MNTPLLKKLSKRKQGWRPSAIHDDKGLIRNACMVTNGGISTKIEVPILDDLKEMDKLLEVQVVKTINELNERDNAIIKRNTLVFSVLASANIYQAEMFKPLLHRDGKQTLNVFINNTEKLVNSLQKDFIAMGGKQMEDMLGELKEVSIKIFKAFGTAIDLGEVNQFLEHVEKYVTPTDTPVVKMEVAKPDAKPFPCTKCGACCKNAASMLEQYKDLGVMDPKNELFFPHKIHKTGRCSKLNKKGECSVYDDRPTICNMAKMQGVLNIPSKEFEEINIAGCNKLMDDSNVPQEFRIPVDVNSTKPSNQ